MTVKLILASASPRRKRLLLHLGLEFEVRASNILEKLDPNLTPCQNAVMLALNKAQAIAVELTRESSKRKAPKYELKILGGDTMVTLDDQCLGKPESAEAAIEMLQRISGRWHEVCTGVALVEVLEKTPALSNRADVDYENGIDPSYLPEHSQQIVTYPSSVFEGMLLRRTLAYEVSKVKMRQFDQSEIEAYVNTGESMDVAGAYALQGGGAALVEKMEGCVSNVIGFPLPLVTKMLQAERL